MTQIDFDIFAPIEEQKAIFERMRSDLQQILNEIINEPNKREITKQEIRLRMNGYLKHLLDVADQDEPLPIIQKNNPDGLIEDIDLAKIFDESSDEYLRGYNTLEGCEDWLIPNILHLILEKVFEREVITNDTIMPIARLLQKVYSVCDKVRAARIRGDYEYEQKFYTLESIPYEKEVITIKKEITNENRRNILLSELIEKYITTQIKDKAWQEHTKIDHKEKLINILDIVGDKAVKDVTRDDIRNLRDILVKLPVSRKKKKEYKNKSIDELISMKHKETLSIKTVNIIIQSISSMFEWAKNEGLVINNPAKALSFKDDQPEIDKRETLTEDDIKKVFFSGDYKPDDFKNLAFYWCPLIGLYTGMRLEEICQLHCDDIYQEEEIWIFDVKEDSSDGLKDKKLKNKNAKRKIPIHDELINLGLIEYLNEISKKSKRLFPKLNKTEKSPKYMGSK